MNYIQEYIDKLRSGEIITSKRVKQLYFNIIEPVIRDEHPGYYFDEDEGELFIKFAETYCKQSIGEEWVGQDIKLMLFQKAKYQAIFGIYDRTTGERRFEEIFDVRGRKNGKSTENAVLGLYLLLRENGAEIYVAATTFNQAARVWEEAKNMKSQSRFMRDLIGHKTFPTKLLYTKRGNSKFSVLSNAVQTQDGLNASAAIIDEVHELPRSRYDILKQAMTSQSHPLLSMITTAGYVREALYDDTYKYMVQVLDGTYQDDKVFPLIYELDESTEIDKPECWIKANPGLGVIKKNEQLKYLVNRMKIDPNLANTVKTKDFNIRGVENQSWLIYDDFDIYEKIEVPGETDPDKKFIKRPIMYTEEELASFDNSLVLGGFDLSRTNDLTAFVTLLFDKVNQRKIAIPMFWMTAAFLRAEMETNSKIPWKQWIDRGFIRISGDQLIDHHDVANFVASNFKTHGWMYQFINYDSYSSSALVHELAQMGYVEDYCLKATIQGYKTLSVPMQTLAADLKERTVCYQGNPVMKWMFSNVVLVQDRNGNFMPDKSKPKRKIDGVAALLNCYVSYVAQPDYYMK
ncbi:MAG: hypothetical protein A2Y16_05425 [Tenericutes bacterium GWF2_57_13]|nr:MAG: hypothetical protein A2Y16_05425 [Tenericutes bacterium GWF2_57_13]